MFSAIDLFAGCGGLTEGLRQSGFKVEAAVEINKDAARTYKTNHPDTILFNEDIRKLKINEVREIIGKKTLHLLAGCPPCQGFSSMRSLNRWSYVEDSRNDLITEFLRFVKGIRPFTIMMENVPAIIEYPLFKKVSYELLELGYYIDFRVVNVADYGVPQRRKRFVMLGSRLGPIKVARGNGTRRTVRDAIGSLESVDETSDPIHKIYPKHSPKVMDIIRRIPKNGGSRKDLPEELVLNCHKRKGIGFNDVYGRLKWDDVSSTITGGCLNPSKGRFLHPEEDRCITAREAALLQTFPRDYKFPEDIGKTALALMIGNALPPLFSKIQGTHIYHHLFSNLMILV